MVVSDAVKDDSDDDDDDGVVRCFGGAAAAAAPTAAAPMKPISLRRPWRSSSALVMSSKLSDRTSTLIAGGGESGQASRSDEEKEGRAMLEISACYLQTHTIGGFAVGTSSFVRILLI